MNIRLNILFLIICSNIFAQSETDTIKVPNLTLPGIYSQEIDTVKHIVDTTKIYEFAIVTTKPEYPGGKNEMMNFIIKNIDTKQIEFNGCTKIFIQFIIDSDGNISKPRIARGCHNELDKEAINIIKKFPKWKPGKMYNIPVKVKYILPINFEYKE